MAGWKQSAAVALSIALSAVVSAEVKADDGHNHAGHNHARHDHPEVVAFRIAEWKEMHFDDAKRAQQHFEAVKGLGCEAKIDSHGSHTDVVYRCRDWKQMTVKNHEQSRQWERWLKASGFDVWHGHVDEQLAHGKEAVDFRLVKWKKLHFESGQAAEQKQITTTLKLLGCQVKEDRHGKHTDVVFRVPVWSTIRVPDHAAADQWVRWLKDTGFETKHSHGKPARQASNTGVTRR